MKARKSRATAVMPSCAANHEAKPTNAIGAIRIGRKSAVIREAIGRPQGRVNEKTRVSIGSQGRDK